MSLVSALLLVVFMLALSTAVFTVSSRFHNRHGRDLSWTIGPGNWITYSFISAAIAYSTSIAHSPVVSILFGIALGVVAGFLGPLFGLLLAMLTSKNGIK